MNARAWRDLVLIETGREGEVRCLPGLSEHELALDSDYNAPCLHLRVYRLQLHALRGDWPAVDLSVIRLQAALKRTNAVGASWLAESAAIAAHGIGEPGLALHLLEQSKALQAHVGVVPTPRQVASWARTQARLHQTPGVAGGAERLELVGRLFELSQDLCAVGGRVDTIVPLRVRRGATPERLVSVAA